MIRSLILFAFTTSLASCTAYSSRFDTGPGRGVVRSVSEIEACIIETEEGADLYVPHSKPRRAVAHRRRQRRSHLQSRRPRASRACRRQPLKVWIVQTQTPDGYCVRGYYVMEPC